MKNIKSRILDPLIGSSSVGHWFVTELNGDLRNMVGVYVWNVVETRMNLGQISVGNSSSRWNWIGSVR